ncbi:hypothetical protein BKA81DRAFT_349374 [Phyllosticta paracitricarpa]
MSWDPGKSFSFPTLYASLTLALKSLLVMASGSPTPAETTATGAARATLASKAVPATLEVALVVLKMSSVTSELFVYVIDRLLTAKSCKQMGHYSRDCPEEKQFTGECYNCGEVG